EYAIRPRRVSDRQTHVTCRHIPRVANLSAFLRCNCDCTIREPCCEHERFITLRSYLRQLDIAAKTSRRALPYSRPDNFVLPGLTPLKGPTVCQNFITYLY